MKVLSLAHDCVAETFGSAATGGPQKFYNGPSPDEVALVEFASKMKFDCISNETEAVKMRMAPPEAKRREEEDGLEDLEERSGESFITESINSEKKDINIKV